MNDSQTQAGFTLIEVLAVLAIATLIMSLALPFFGSKITPTKLDAAAYRLATLFETERYAARSSGQPTQLLIETDARQFHSARTNSRVQLPSAITIGIDTRKMCAEGAAFVTFFPDGRACSPSIQLSGASITITLEINTVTGAISIVH